jgi:Calcium binding
LAPLTRLFTATKRKQVSSPGHQIVDAYTPKEQIKGWYSSLEDRLRFPFMARCAAERSSSPLRVGEEVEVVGMTPEGGCQHQMFVLIDWERRTLAVPLAQLQGLAVDEQTGQVIEDGSIGSRRVRAVSNADLEGGTAWRLATPLLGPPCRQVNA